MMRRVSSRYFEYCVNVLSLAALGALGFAGLQHDGFVRQSIRDWRQARRREGVVALLRAPEQWRVGRLDSALGPPDVAIFVDYQCPFCARLDRELDSLRSTGRAIAVSIRHYPLARHMHAEMAARAAVCAERMGGLAQYHQALFAQDWVDRSPEWGRLATDVGIRSRAEFEACMRSADSADRVAQDAGLAQGLGGGGTPVMVIGQLVVAGYVLPDSLIALLERGTVRRSEATSRALAQ